MAMNDKIIVTGACGFIGSHLTEMLVEKGNKVIAFDRYNNNNDYGWLQNSKYINEIEFILGDIRDYDSVYKCMKKGNTIFHLAALIGIPYSYTSPLAYLKTNVEGTYNVLESAKNLSYQEILITSTSETYGTAQFIPITEKHPLVGQSPYAASKIAADQLSISYLKSFNLPIKIIRPFNTFGPRQSNRAIIPTIISQILSKNKNVYLGNLKTKRDLTYVKDTCNAFLKILDSKESFGEVLNVGSNKNISIEELYQLISDKMNSNKTLNIDNERVRPKNSEVENLLCDNSKINKITKWKAEYNLSEALDETIEWMKNNIERHKSDIYNV